MSVGKGFMGGFGGCLGVGCAVVVVLIAIPVGCLMIGGVAVHNAQQTGHELAEKSKTASPGTPVTRDDAKPIVKDKEINRLTAENFARIEDGMTYAQVKRIIGPASEETASASSGMDTEFATKIVMLTWKGSWGANGNVTFQNGRVTAKAQLGLPHGEATEDLPDEDAEQAKAKAAAQAEEHRKAEARAAEERQAAAKRKAEHEAAIDKAKWHTWTSADGQHKIEAKFVTAIGDTAQLEKKDGTIIKIKRDKLSDEDWTWITNKGWNNPE
jgi:hypothetical protein